MIRPLSLLLVPALLCAAPKILSPAATVQKQIETFNAHDLEGFLALFADDLEVADLPAGAAPPTGKARLRERYAELFKTNPDLRASAEAQMTSGDIVVQKERIKGRAGKKEALEVVVIYQVKEGRIVRMWTLGGVDAASLGARLSRTEGLAFIEMANHGIPDSHFQGLQVIGLGDHAFSEGPGGKTPLRFLSHLKNDLLKSVGHGFGAPEPVWGGRTTFTIWAGLG